MPQNLFRFYKALAGKSRRLAWRSPGKAGFFFVVIIGPCREG